MKILLFCLLFGQHFRMNGGAMYVDKGNPYTDQPLKVGELTITKTAQKSPLHTKVYFPQEAGTYPVVVFIGGLNGYILVELYETVLYRIASHGFIVFGIDYRFPADNVQFEKENNLQQDISKFFDQYTWLQNYMSNKTVATIAWNTTGLVCHSSGCDVTLKMIKEKPKLFKSTVFLEPYSQDVKDKIDIKMPAFMYGTQLSEEGNKCAIPGYDYNTFYDLWSCPKIVMNVADFGHCDILDPEPWAACRDVHHCKITTNTTKLPEYHEFVQGAVSSFLVNTLQNRTDALKYITQKLLIPLNLLELKTDLNCTKSLN
ncbi:uncharacterized protein [Mytilus edulis]|uniref:uncharacterized protein n=1 Tax=Mytilus edulis TaxID=6550 RepID=UPI0039EE1AA4